MTLKFKKNYLSITEFEEINLPNFTILTGLNGTGKSQLFSAIKSEDVEVDSIPKESIALFQSSIFRLENEQAVKLLDLQTEKANIFSSMKQEINNRATPYISNDNLLQISQIAENSEYSFYELPQNLFTELHKPELLNPYINYVSQVNYYLNDIQSGGINPTVVKPILKRISKQIKKPLEFLTKEEFVDLFNSISYKNDFLINSLTRIFSDYWERLDLNTYNSYQNEKFGKAFPILNESEFVRKYGEKPWEIINKIMSTFGSLQYHINNPEGIERGFEYTVKLISNDNPSLEIQFDSLSSGERVMMALVATLYKTRVDNYFPSLLLLDEIDSSLHPSMTKGLLDVIEKELVQKKNLKVILITHSPSTVALSPEESVYLMNKLGPKRITKSSKKEALHILSEGFASLTNAESNLQVSYNIKKTSKYVLLTEGITDRIILEAAWKKLETKNINFDIQDCFDASFLRNLFARGEIFTNYPDKTFIALFDFDTEGYNAWNGLSNFEMIENDPCKGLVKKHKHQNAYVMLLPVPEGDIKKQVIKHYNITFAENAHMPIELLFYGIDELSTNFQKEVQVGGGTLVKFKGNKTAFAEKVSDIKPENFINLKPLLEGVKKVFI